MLQETKKELLFQAQDTGWNREMPVTLFTYQSGEQDLHRQTGTDFDTAIARAREILAQRGLAVGEVEFIGPTGAYMPVTALRGTP